jgi:epoxyqueuosine reductase
MDADLAEASDDRIFGCDACQEACPFNYRVKTSGVDGFLRDIAGAAPLLADILKLKRREEFTGRFAGSPLMRAGRNGLVRNACAAAGNSGDSSLIPLLVDLLGDSDPGIAAHADMALRRLRKSPCAPV